MDGKNSGLEVIRDKYRSAKRMLMRLEEAVYDLDDVLKDVAVSEATVRTYRNPMTKLFEITFDVFWKYINEYQWGIHGINVNSPKQVFRECLKLELLLPDQVSQFPPYHALMKQLLSKTIPTYDADDEK